jgi:flagellar hook assembly protein FlgD
MKSGLYPGIVAAVLGGCIAFNCAARAESGYISAVAVSSEVLDLAKGEEVRLRFTLDRDAAATVVVYGGSHAAVRTVAIDRPSFRGVNTVAWNGRDNAGKPVPNEAYYFTIVCVDNQRQKATCDPAVETGGEAVAFTHRDMHYDAKAGGVSYRLKSAARVQIRAGVAGGALLKTVVNWAPRPSGAHLEPWGGKDESGLVDVMALENHFVTGRAYDLPANSVIVTGSPAVAPASAVAAGEVKAQERARQIRAAMTRRERPIEPHVWTPFGSNAAPRFSVSLVGTQGALRSIASTSTGGEVGIRVELDSETRLRLLEQRFEIVAYVDFQLVGEQEQGYSPYTYVLDTSTIAPGRHIVTINVAGLEDQLAARSIAIDIE